MSNKVPDGYYAVWCSDLETLLRIKTRLYDGSRPLSPDEKRDLASAMDAILDRVRETPINDEPRRN